jgi:protein-tyrosine phosphatase
MSETSLTESLWWVIPNRLGGMRKPTPEEIPTLTEIGVNAIVSVMDDPSNLDLYEQAGLPHRWLPTTGGKPPTLEQVEEFVQFVDDQNAQSHRVVVHCSSGRRRTGTFLAAYLIKSGQSVEQALATVDRSNPLVELREAQIHFLKSLGR